MDQDVFYVTLERAADLQGYVETETATYPEPPFNLETKQNAHVMRVTVERVKEIK